jgi:TetR/AcrR family transcriptional regulator, transcriptional repressor for nem operon
MTIDMDGFGSETRPMSLVAGYSPPMHETKRRLLEASLELMLQRGYSGLGVQDVLDRTGIPKGSFYHHFESKQDMALQAVDLYTATGHELLRHCLTPNGVPALMRVRTFFEQLADFYATQGYLGCLLGTLGQELAGANEVFRKKIETCLTSLAAPIAECLEQARTEGDLPADTDTSHLANVLLDAWEGAALRSRLLRSPEPLNAVLDFCIGALAAR